uniref:Uncharacterized protein n=1 Tax=Timema douglasi TaxID=61478 RepID=A0A7R8VJU1_TIMDO|nr:unnamed protein product [Timema douglasi]
MGLKFASWRHPDVFVMAPALTEAGQSQNFKLPPTHSLPASPISVALNELKNLPVSKLLSNGHLLCNGSLASKFQETKNPFDNQCIKRVAKDLYKESLYSKSLFLSEVTSIKESGRLPLPSEDAKVSGNIATDKKGGYMMSECDPSMGDQDTMGLHKSSASLEVDSLLKEKTLSNEMDQLFKNLGAAISSNDLESSADLGQNVEELLQVIKSIESGAADGVEMCHMDPVETAESESMFPTDFTGALSTFERELLNDVDVMNMCVGDVDTSSGLENKEVHTKERIEEAHKRQFELERRCERLLRRLRKYQARVMGKHVAEEVTSLLEFVQRTIRTTPHREGGDVNSSEGAGSSKTDGKGSPLMGLLRKLDMISQQQAAVSARHHVINKYFGSGSSDRSPSSHGQPYGLRTLPRLTTETKLELEHVSGRMHTQLKLVETSMDSDATASSSGGESCDEMQAFNNHHQVHVSM